ncbi:hypothetical protein HHL22_09555 [Hymenobacter sp. RP-2-7]|uniref:Uncharacterized protein n=1 Tax=Hymenobacter polaris TaxID=2682546 RepID=A0A7Y0ADP5_9BACT|nr:hypothetical protein [Hymenobacter polaris]NML65449.1 hypothetical protein [Hymenobacter polaris]
MSQPDLFLLSRPDDLVTLGVQFVGFRPVLANAAGQPPTLVAQSDAARIVLSFPPQALAEEKYTLRGATDRRGARLSNPSHLTFALPANTSVALSAQGVLAALAQAGQVAGPAEANAMLLELPWRLSMAVQAPAGNSVVADYAPLPITSAAGVAGLWQLRLRARSAPPGSAGLALLPLSAGADEAGLDTAPLSYADRQAIVSAQANGLAAVQRLELSALGGSLAARLQQPALQWAHETTLGRDRKVLITMGGILYPFGHRAEYSVVAERTFDASGSQAVAGLLRQQLLVVTEPVRSFAEGDAALVRQFPFHEVELLTRSYSDLALPQQAAAPGDWQLLSRKPYPPDNLKAQLSELTAQAETLGNTLTQRLADLPQTPQQLLDLGYGSAPALQEAQANLALYDPAGLLAQQRAIDRQLDALRPRPRPTTRPPSRPRRPLSPDELGDGSDQNGDDQNGDPGNTYTPTYSQEYYDLLATRPSNQAIQEAQQKHDFYAQQVAQLQAAVQQEFAAIPRSMQQLAASGDADATQYLALQGQIGSLQAVLAQIAAAAQQTEPLYFVPHTAAGSPVQFALRCAAANGDVHFSTPLLFVRDVHYEATQYFPAFASLIDADVAGRLAATWASTGDDNAAPAADMAAAAVGPPPAGALAPRAAAALAPLARVAARRQPLPGVPIDLIRSANRLAGDIHEVHALSIAAVQYANGFWPSLAQFEVELPAVRTLLPEQSKRVALAYADEFLHVGDQAAVPLALVDKLVVDFTRQADRSGGLVAPKFTADGISRTLGLVPTGALPLPAGLPDLATLYAGATLLGFPLGEVINLAETTARNLPLSPAIVPLLLAGQPPGVQMEWPGLPLKSYGPLKTTDATTLDLHVELSPLKTETTCTVENISVVLPPTGTPFLTLTFESLVFKQENGKAPDLKISKPKVEFEGALKLLRVLQEKLQQLLDLGDSGPTVEVTSVGLTASYTFAVPSVQMGGFLLRNIAFRTAVEVPFDGRPVTVGISFARRDNPFNLSVLLFGGGGYIDLLLGPAGLLRLEASMEFGAAVAVDFLVASGEVHALGGVRYVQRGADIEVDGYLRFGGSVQVLGLVSVSVELVLTLHYDSELDKLWGQATLVLEINLLLYADSVELDSGPWVLYDGPDNPLGVSADPAPASRRVPGPPPAGLAPAAPVAEGLAPRVLPPAFLAAASAAEADLQTWQTYQAAFAP